MALWNVEGFKIIVVQFDFRAFHDFEAKAGEDVNNDMERLGERMSPPNRDPSARKCHIDLFFF